jgi:hypothetical protein
MTLRATPRIPNRTGPSFGMLRQCGCSQVSWGCWLWSSSPCSRATLLNLDWAAYVALAAVLLLALFFCGLPNMGGS